jgi:hypothetical protein
MTFSEKTISALRSVIGFLFFEKLIPGFDPSYGDRFSSLCRYRHDIDYRTGHFSDVWSIVIGNATNGAVGQRLFRATGRCGVCWRFVVRD